MGFIKGFFKSVGTFIKKHPVATIFIALGIVVAGLFLTYEALHYTSKPEFCQMCHPNEGTGPLAEYATWHKSLHARAGVECLDCHSKAPGAVGYMRAKLGGLYDVWAEFTFSKEKKLELLTKASSSVEESTRLVPDKVCMHCHSDEVNATNRQAVMSFAGVYMRLLDTVINPEFRNSFGLVNIGTDAIPFGVDPNHASHIAQGLSCATCHQGVAHRGGVNNLPLMPTCFECHDQNRAAGKELAFPNNDDCVVCHQLQKNMQEGNVAESLGVTGDRWYMADLACSDCHESAFIRPVAATCLNCHDEGYDQLMVDTQVDFADRIEAFSANWDKEFLTRKTLTGERLALFNKYQRLYFIVKRDGSMSVHNPDYTSAILDEMATVWDAYTALK